MNNGFVFTRSCTKGACDVVPKVLEVRSPYMHSGVTMLGTLMRLDGQYVARLVVVELSSTFDITKVSRQRDSELDRLGFWAGWTVLALDASRSPLALRCLLLVDVPLLRRASDVGG